jgi:hypothetical protein
MKWLILTLKTSLSRVKSLALAYLAIEYQKKTDSKVNLKPVLLYFNEVKERKTNVNKK